mmetsp:Transcript_7776/g.14158  ORF Transcript_7776/g.14158 Transcript_7776/m.14158 type:complete len:133 (+) Transcript_7776:2791-3189(+)
MHALDRAADSPVSRLSNMANNEILSLFHVLTVLAQVRSRRTELGCFCDNLDRFSPSLGYNFSVGVCSYQMDCHWAVQNWSVPNLGFLLSTLVVCECVSENIWTWDLGLNGAFVELLLPITWSKDWIQRTHQS